MRNYIKDLSFHHEGINQKIVDSFVRKKKVKSYECSYDFVTILDKNYPRKLLDLSDPPMILYYQGDLGLLNENCISVVGSRRPNEYAIQETRRLVQSIREEYVIVSGLAYGIDVTAHEEALNHQTIAVLGCGLSHVYPKQHEKIQKNIAKKHLLITEFPENTGAKKYHFPIRNRIIASLSEKIIIMAGSEKSGTMHTANIALELNKQIYCLPYRIDEISGKACNMLIQEGAMMLTKENDLYNI